MKPFKFKWIDANKAIWLLDWQANRPLNSFYGLCHKLSYEVTLVVKYDMYVQVFNLLRLWIKPTWDSLLFELTCIVPFQELRYLSMARSNFQYTKVRPFVVKIFNLASSLELWIRVWYVSDLLIIDKYSLILHHGGCNHFFNKINTPIKHLIVPRTVLFKFG